MKRPCCIKYGKLYGRTSVFPAINSEILCVCKLWQAVCMCGQDEGWGPLSHRLRCIANNLCSYTLAAMVVSIQLKFPRMSLHESPCEQWMSAPHYPWAARLYFHSDSQTVAERHCSASKLIAEWARCCGNRLPLWPTDEEHLECFCSATSFLSPIWPGDVANSAMHVDTWLQGPQIGYEMLQYSYLTGLPHWHCVCSFHMCGWCWVQGCRARWRVTTLQITAPVTLSGLHGEKQMQDAGMKQTCLSQARGCWAQSPK